MATARTRPLNTEIADQNDRDQKQQHEQLVGVVIDHEEKRLLPHVDAVGESSQDSQRP